MSPTITGHRSVPQIQSPVGTNTAPWAGPPPARRRAGRRHRFAAGRHARRRPLEVGGHAARHVLGGVGVSPRTRTDRCSAGGPASVALSPWRQDSSGSAGPAALSSGTGTRTARRRRVLGGNAGEHVLSPRHALPQLTIDERAVDRDLGGGAALLGEDDEAPACWRARASRAGNHWAACESPNRTMVVAEPDRRMRTARPGSRPGRGGSRRGRSRAGRFAAAEGRTQVGRNPVVRTLGELPRVGRRQLHRAWRSSSQVPGAVVVVVAGATAFGGLVETVGPARSRDVTERRCWWPPSWAQSWWRGRRAQERPPRRHRRGLGRPTATNEATRRGRRGRLRGRGPRRALPASQAEWRTGSSSTAWVTAAATTDPARWPRAPRLEGPEPGGQQDEGRPVPQVDGVGVPPIHCRGRRSSRAAGPRPLIAPVPAATTAAVATTGRSAAGPGKVVPSP